MSQEIRFKSPSNNLLLASDPRIPDEDEYFSFELTPIDKVDSIVWYVNDKKVGRTVENMFHWHVQRGHYTARAKVWLRETPNPSRHVK
jgi:membrane carboxypeptidase/penicillin-binding protein PbpC